MAASRPKLEPSGAEKISLCHRSAQKLVHLREPLYSVAPEERYVRLTDSWSGNAEHDASCEHRYDKSKWIDSEVEHDTNNPTLHEQ